jgi:hypothetical protein
MIMTASAWRTVRGALAALVLITLALGPSIDGFICRDDGGTTAAAAEMVAVEAPHNHAAPHSDGGEDVCVHGHCHHGALSIPATLGSSSAPLIRSIETVVIPRGRITVTNLLFGLMRPPRG